MAKTNWQDPKTGEIISPQISGLQEAIGKIEESINIETVTEADIPLVEVFISNDDRCRIYQAPEGMRNWILSPTPIIKKNGVVITDDFEFNYGGGAVIFTTPILESDVLTADATYTKKIEGKQLSTNDYSNEEKLKNQDNKDDILNLSETVGDTTIDDALIPISDTGLSVKVLLSWLGNMIKTITGKSSWRIKPTKNLEELNTALGAHKADMTNRGFSKTVKSISEMDLDTLLATGFYGGNVLTNAPDVSYYYVEVVSYNGSNLVKQRLTQVTGVDSGLIWERVKNTNWTPWRKIIRDIPIPLIDATLQNGWVNGSTLGGLKYYKDAFGEVHLSGEIKDGVVTNGTVITTLPTGYRPRTSLPITCIKANDGSPTSILVHADGTVVFYGQYTVGVFRMNGSFKAI